MLFYMEDRGPLRRGHMRLRAILAGAGSLLDLWGASAIIQPPMRPRASTVAEALSGDSAKIGEDLGRVYKRERGKAA
jgi:hypothetical protein